MPNYQNIGFVNEGLSRLKMPTFAPKLSNTLAGAPNTDVLGLLGRGGAAAATGGVSEIIAQVLNLIPAIFQGIQGRKQLKQAEELEKRYPLPTAEIAPSIDKLTGYTYGRTLRQDLPGGEIMRNQLSRATASGLRAASELGSGAEAYGMLGELVGREQAGLSDLARMTAQQVAGYEGDYMQALQAKAGEENRVWEWNKAQPYLQAAAMAQQLRESGMKNQYSAMGNIFGSTAEAVSPDFNASLLYGRDNARSTGKISSEELAEIIKGLRA